MSIAVRMYKASENHDFELHQVHRSDGGRIRYQRVCEIDGEEVPYDEIAKGHQLDDGKMVILDDDDLDKLPITTNKVIDVVEVVPAAQVDPIYYDGTYYLAPDANSEKPYELLRRVLTDSDRVAVVKVALRQRESLALLRAREDLLVLHSMLWPDEIRSPDFDFLDRRTQVRKQELQMAASLIDSMESDFDPDAFSDDYVDAMRELIKAKAKGAELPERPEPEQGEVVDLMTALQRSVEAAKSRSAKPSRPARAQPAKSKPARSKSTKAQSTKPQSAGAKPSKAKSGSSQRKKRSA